MCPPSPPSPPIEPVVIIRPVSALIKSVAKTSHAVKALQTVGPNLNDAVWRLD